MTDKIKLISVLKKMVSFNITENTNAEALINQLRYYKCINSILIDMLELASKKEYDNVILQSLLQNYLIYVKAYEPYLISTSLGKISNDSKQELLNLIEASNIEEIKDIFNQFIN